MIGLSALGLLLSFAINIASWLGVDVPMIGMVLHLGIFAVFVPAVFILKDEAGGGPPPASPTEAIEAAQSRFGIYAAQLPGWAKASVVLIFMYGWACAAMSMLMAIAHDGFQSHQSLTPEGQRDLFRMFSGVWLAFYCVALAFHWAVPRVRQEQWKSFPRRSL